MPQAELRILLVEDNPDDADLTARQLKRAGLAFELRCVESKPDFLAALDSFAPTLIISDFSLPNFDGMAALNLATERLPDVPFIFVSGTLGEDRAVESLKHGAADYVVKGNLARLAPSVRRAIEDARLRAEHRHALQELRASEARFRLLAEQVPVGISLATPDGKSTYVNKYWRETSGIDGYEGDSWARNIHPEDRDWVLQQGRDNTAAGQDFVAEYRYVLPDGEVKWAVAKVIPQRDEGGAITAYIAVLHDITERKQAEDKIARLSRVHAMMSGINAAVVRHRDRRDLLDEVCRVAVEKGNFRVAFILESKDNGHTKLVARYGAVPSFFGRLVAATRNGGVAEGRGTAGEALRTRQLICCNEVQQDERMRPWRDALVSIAVRSVVSIPLIVNEQAIGVLVLLAAEPNFFTEEESALLKQLAADVSFALDKIEKQARLDYLAYYDPLTGLANRGLFEDRLSMHLRDAQRHGQQIGVAVFDLDRFRQINESFGRLEADRLLQEYANRLRRFAKEPEYLAHFGGDMFACLLPEVGDGPALAGLAETRMAHLLQQPFTVADEQLAVSHHIGIALFPADGLNAEMLVRNAEAALKQAKATGDTVTFYAREINARARERVALETRLRRAIEEEQFVLHYQPKLALASRRVTSVEALIRWQDPSSGLVPPAQFIPILEHTGMINDVGRWALSQARRDYAAMRTRLATPPRIAVNVSPMQLRKTSFLQDVTDVLGTADDHGIDLEITESLIMQNVEDNIPKLDAIRELAVRIAIDDFGTGYSSLSYIARLPLDMLKIDRAFILNMSTEADDMTIVATVISLAHALDLTVIAEGVETEEQARLLNLLKCDEAQGFLFCEPLPLDTLMARLTPEGLLLPLPSGNAPRPASERPPV